jgi:valyl-tRNA synthetase
MMMMGLHFTGKVPFKTVYINALVRDEKGQKMSKSKGNVVDPLVLLNTYGADALRFTLAALAAPGRDVKFSKAQVEGYRNFATKLWNAARFVEMNGCVFDPHFQPDDLKAPLNQWIVGKVTTLSKDIKEALESYKFNDAAHLLYHFIWGTFCDWYLEFCKPKFASEGAEKEETQKTVTWVLDQLLHFLHPFMPYVTETLWQNLRPKDGLLMGTSWPDELDYTYSQASQDIDWLIQVVSEIRSLRAEMNVSPATFLSVSFYDALPKIQRRIEDHKDLLLKLARLNHIHAFSEPLSQKDAVGAAQVIVEEATLLIPLAEAIDIGAEKERLQKEFLKNKQDIESIEKKLSNQDFVSRAPQEIVETQQKRLEKARLENEKLAQALERLG